MERETVSGYHRVKGRPARSKTSIWKISVEWLNGIQRHHVQHDDERNQHKERHIRTAFSGTSGFLEPLMSVPSVILYLLALDSNK